MHSDITPSSQTTQALGKSVIFYWWTWLSKHNKNRSNAIAHWKSRWRSSRAESCSLKSQIKSIWSFAWASGKIVPQMKETEEVSPLFLGWLCSSWWMACGFLLHEVSWQRQGDWLLLIQVSRLQSWGMNERAAWAFLGPCQYYARGLKLLAQNCQDLMQKTQCS